MKRQTLTLVALLVVALLALSACGSKKSSSSSNTTTSGTSTASGSTSVSGKIQIVGVWTGDEQKHFQAVLNGFKAKYPKVKVTYRSTGDNTPTVLSTAVQGGNPPDLASVSQPGLVSDFQKKGALKKMNFARATVLANYPADIEKLGEIKGNLYGLIIKAANKSTVWYNVKSYSDAGVKPPTTWADFLKDAKTLKASGTSAYSIGGADGWTLTDLFENIYLRQAGPDMYDKLSKHTIKWTDPSVKKALTTMSGVLGDSGNIVGGTAGALQTDFPTSVSNVFSTAPKASQVIEGDFVPGVVASSNKLKAVTGYNVFPFPAVGSSGTNVVEGGGDELMMFRDTPAIRALVNYLSTGEAQTIWAKLGGYSAPAKTVPASAYPDEITRTTATAIGQAKTFRFDLSDLQPASFGGTVGQGEFKIFQDFLKTPSNVNGIAQSLETAAAKAYATGK
ncbi:MAG: extracellular solute-binding protein [Actinobacteria bacterium]|nr:extracellular solute-binding protein [Actinomycetota bacterium]